MRSSFCLPVHGFRSGEWRSIFDGFENDDFTS
jgi:hypothetical protein